MWPQVIDFHAFPHFTTCKVGSILVFVSQKGLS
jgi:hypothetical protein